jgi:hypothetical protein
VRRTAEAQVDALVLVAVREDAVGNTCVHEQTHAVAFEDPSTVRRLDVVHGPDVQDDGLDAGGVQQVRQHQAGGPASDDGDVGASVGHGPPRALECREGTRQREAASSAE